MPTYDTEGYSPPAPIATVTLQTLDGQNRIRGVTMQIDTGADLSLIPQSSISLLGLDNEVKHDAEVMRFDGSISVAKSVKCDLIFLRRAFRGVYLIVDSTTGILGRDVLNHLVLTFDGPKLSWQET